MVMSRNWPVSKVSTVKSIFYVVCPGFISLLFCIKNTVASCTLSCKKTCDCAVIISERFGSWKAFLGPPWHSSSSIEKTKAYDVVQKEWDVKNTFHTVSLLLLKIDISRLNQKLSMLSALLQLISKQGNCKTTKEGNRARCLSRLFEGLLRSVMHLMKCHSLHKVAVFVHFLLCTGTAA